MGRRDAAGQLGGDGRDTERRVLDGSVLFIPAAALAGIAIGAAAHALGAGHASTIWMATLVVTGSIVVARTLGHVRRGQWASDIIATLAIVTAAVLEQPLAGLIVVVMQTGGEALERYAEGRASDAVRALEADAPRIAHVLHDGDHTDVPVSEVAVGDMLLVRPGDLVPCDGVVVDGIASLDTSRLTGEPLPCEVRAGSEVQSGSINGDRSFVMRATALAQASQYARIVELVRTAQASKAPFQRMADRYAVWFTPLALVVAAVAALISHDVQRVLAVLVVATPCPLILAPPIAIIGGMNRAARRHIIIRDGGAVERLATVDTAVFDKTGTLTIGKPAVREVVPRPPFTRAQVLELGASVEQVAAHLLARTLVDAAREESVVLRPVRDGVESPGRGVVGNVDGHVVAVGARTFVAEHASDQEREIMLGEAPPDGLAAYVAIDGRFAGTVRYADALRDGVGEGLEQLHALGLRHLVLLSGDEEKNVRAVADRVGIEDARGGLRPDDKVAVVRELIAAGHRVLMIGDGTNDAPALSAATVGIALAGHGGGVSAEAADIVILVDDLSRVVDAIRISRRTMRIAHQSVWAGITLSGIAMIVAALGHIAPIGGAILQEVIDVGVILNALRASARSRHAPASMPRATSRVARPLPIAGE